MRPTSCCVATEEGLSPGSTWPVALPQSWHPAYGIENADQFWSWEFKYVFIAFIYLFFHLFS